MACLAKDGQTKTTQDVKLSERFFSDGTRHILFPANNTKQKNYDLTVILYELSVQLKGKKQFLVVVGSINLV